MPGDKPFHSKIGQHRAPRDCQEDPIIPKNAWGFQIFPQERMVSRSKVPLKNLLNRTLTRRISSMVRYRHFGHLISVQCASAGR